MFISEVAVRGLAKTSERGSFREDPGLMHLLRKAGTVRLTSTTKAFIHIEACSFVHNLELP